MSTSIRSASVIIAYAPRTPRVSRYSLAVPDTVNIPPSQSAAYIETNLLHVIPVENEKKKNTHVVITDIRLKASTKGLLATVPHPRTIYYRNLFFVNPSSLCCEIYPQGVLIIDSRTYRVHQQHNIKQK